MRIALLGYGKMGKAIEEIARSKGHTIGLKSNGEIPLDLKNIDVAIDFSLPTVAVHNITECISEGIPVVSGTTGWLDKYEEVVAKCRQEKGAFLYASNFSVGVNVFFELNRMLAQLMEGLDQYQPDLKEIHHTQKLDAPSGTAITLAEGIIEHSNKEAWKLQESDNRIDDTDLPIASERTGTVPGTHIIRYKSPIDTIEISHEAHSRAGFAQGALLAAEWLVGREGVFSMKDVLNIK